MGVFSITVKIWNPAQPGNKEELEVVVDTGASYSWILRSRLEPLGIQSVRRMKFRTIEGRMIERDLAPVFLAVDGYTGGDNVVLAETGDAEVLGARSLESLGLTVNPVEKKLEPSVGLALTARVHKRRFRVVEAQSWESRPSDRILRQDRYKHVPQASRLKGL